MVVSEHIIAEITRTFEQPYFRQRLTPTQRANSLALLREEAIITPLTVELHGVATHQEDDLVLATAISAKADYLVTGDRKLQQLGAYQGVRILSPGAFLELLSSEGLQGDAQQRCPSLSPAK